MSQKPLNRIETFRNETDVNVVIETRKGSRNKIDFDVDREVFELAGVLPEGSVFPFDFGFLPSTLGEDGDPLDVLVLLDESLPTGCLVAARIIGVIKANQTEKDGQTLRNDRLVSVATHAHTHSHINNLDDLRPQVIEEIEHFFVSYNETKGKQFEPLGRSGPDDALGLIREAIESFDKAVASKN